MNKRYYIAYGSNLNTRQMAVRCPDAEIYGTAVLKDSRLRFRGSKTGSYLTVEYKEGCSVPVAIWSVSREDEKHLDRYEGYPDFYYKKELTVQVMADEKEEAEELEAFIYIMHEDRPYGIPSTLYMNICAEGYMDFGFDTQLLADAYMESLEADK